MQAKNYDIDTSGMSIKQLKSFFGTALKAANDRIRTLTKPDNITGAQAYKYNVEPLRGAGYIKTRTDKASGREMTVFTQPKAPRRGASEAEQKRYGAQLREAVSQVKRFLSAKTSTVAGIKEVQQERRAQLDDLMNDRGIGGGAGTGLSNDDKDAILRWMGSPEGRDAMSKFDSHQVREGITTAVIANRSTGQQTSVSSLFNQFEQSQQTFADWIDSNENMLMELGDL